MRQTLKILLTPVVALPVGIAFTLILHRDVQFRQLLFTSAIAMAGIALFAVGVSLLVNWLLPAPDIEKCKSTLSPEL